MKGLPVKNGTEGRLTTLEILTMFILTLFFFMGCTAARQPELESAPLSFSPGQATSTQNRGVEYPCDRRPAIVGLGAYPSQIF